MSRSRGESNVQYEERVPRDSIIGHRSRVSRNPGVISSPAKDRSSQRASRASNGGYRSSHRERSLPSGLQADVDMPEEEIVRSARNSRRTEDLRREAISRSALRAEKERYANPQPTPLLDVPEPFRQRGDGQETGQTHSRRTHQSQGTEEDEGMCSEDEHDIKMLQKKRRQRERRNLSDNGLEQRLRQSQTETEFNALAGEVKRRNKAARISKVFGGVPSTAKSTRKALDEAGWGRRK